MTVATTAPTPGLSDSSGLSTGTTAGIGAGVGGAAVVAFLVAVCWYVRRKQQRTWSQPQVSEQTYTAEANLYNRNSEPTYRHQGFDHCR